MSHPERIVPDETERGIVALHLKRYEFASRWCGEKRVLDVACGVGYGTAHLAAVAARATGIDADAEAIAYARTRYPRPNVDFEVMDATALAFPAAVFDVACAFEAIEHVDDPRRTVAEVARVLRDDGVFFASTPRADRTTLRPENPWHSVEFAQADFEALLRTGFDDVEIYGQRRLQTRRHRALQRVDVLGLRRRLAFLRAASRLLGTPPMAEVTAAEIVIAKDGIDRASELVAVCRRPRR